MKNKLIYLFAAVLMLTACDLKEDHTFDISPDERLGAILDEYNNALVSSPNGWILSLDTNAGGYQLYMNFNDQGRVMMLSDQEATFANATGSATTPKESSYIVRGLQMPSLLFDTYNYLHMLCDPAGSENGGSNGTGLGTDFEFDIVSYSGGVFTLHGIFNKRYAYLRQATADEAQAIMAGGLKAVHNKLNDYIGVMAAPVVQIGDKGVQVTTNGRNFTMTYVTEEGGMVDKTVSCYMDMSSIADSDQPISNIKFINPIVIDDVTITGMKWNGEALETVSENSDVKSTLFDNKVPPFPLGLGLNKSYNTLYFTVPEDYEGTVSQKYLDTYYNPARTKYTSFGRRIDYIKCKFMRDGNSIPVMNVEVKSVTISSGAIFYASFNVYYTENEDGSLTFTDRTYVNGNALNYGRYMRGMIDIFNYIEYQTYTYAYSGLEITTPVVSKESYTLKADWVTNNTPGLSGKIGGFYRVDDPEMYFCGVLSYE